MYNVERVLPTLFGRVGWKQPTQTEYAILTEPNTLSKSKRWFQQVYSAVSIQNIKDTWEDSSISDVDFNELLIDKQRSGIIRTLDRVFNSMETVDVIQTFDREVDIPATLIENQNNFVGYRVKIAPKPDYATALSRVALYFDKDCSFELKCFVDNKAQAIWTKLVTAIGGEVTFVEIDDLVLSYMSDLANTTIFYIGYFQSDLDFLIDEAKAYNESVMWWKYGCLWYAQSFEAPEAGVKFDLPVRAFTSKTYGLNLQFTSYKDHTNRIIAQPQLFDAAVELQIACDVCEQILNSTRSNNIERITKEQLGDIYRELNQEQPTSERPYAPGLKARYEAEIGKLHKSFFGQEPIETHTTPYDVYSAGYTRYR